MQQHTKVYYTFFGYDECDFVPCEVCGNKAVDIHHIKPKSSFGSKLKGTNEGEQDHISNLIALCRFCHDSAHCYKWSKQELFDIHNAVLAKQKGQTI